MLLDVLFFRPGEALFGLAYFAIPAIACMGIFEMLPQTLCVPGKIAAIFFGYLAFLVIESLILLTISPYRKQREGKE